jgi:hypothetical protein
LPGARELDIAVAYVRKSGVTYLRQRGVPPKLRVVAGTGFAITDPEARWLRRSASQGKSSSQHRTGLSKPD